MNSSPVFWSFSSFFPSTRPLTTWSHNRQPRRRGSLSLIVAPIDVHRPPNKTAAGRKQLHPPSTDAHPDERGPVRGHRWAGASSTEGQVAARKQNAEPPPNRSLREQTNQNSRFQLFAGSSCLHQPQTPGPPSLRRPLPRQVRRSSGSKSSAVDLGSPRTLIVLLHHRSALHQTHPLCC